MIYVLKEEGSNYYKIGEAKKVMQRRSNLKAGNPRRLILIDSFSTYVRDKVFKTILSDYYIDLGGGTEWYEISPKEINKVLRKIKTVCEK